MNSKICNVFEKLSKVGKVIISVLTFLCFLYLTVWSFLGTTLIEKTDKNGAYIFYNYDNIPLNIIILLLVCVIMYTLFSDILKKINSKIFSAILSVYVMFVGIYWIVEVKSLPASDSEAMINYACKFLAGDYASFLKENGSEYFYRYPFQLGYTLFCQLVIPLFKDNYYTALQIANVLALVCIYLGLIKIVSYLFNDKYITNTTILLFFGCVQPILFCTFMYGTLIGFAFGVWTIYFAIKYIKTDKKSNIVISAILLGISIVLKPNNMIIMVAICIVLLLKFLDTRKVFDIVGVLLCFLIGSNLINIVVSAYEYKIGVDFGDGMPQIVWANMGLHESGMNNGYGWFNPKYGREIFDANDCDAEKTSEIAKEQVLEQLEYFKDNPDYANTFFNEKILSTWNDPTYSCIFISRSRPHDGEISEFVENMYSGTEYEKFKVFCNQYQQIIFLFASVFLGTLIKKKDVSLYIIPLVLLGGFLYHIVFETKAYYTLTYFILLVPMASYSITQLLSSKSLRHLKRHLKACATK